MSNTFLRGSAQYQRRLHIPHNRAPLLWAGIGNNKPLNNRVVIAVRHYLAVLHILCDKQCKYLLRFYDRDGHGGSGRDNHIQANSIFYVLQALSQISSGKTRRYVPRVLPFLASVRGIDNSNSLNNRCVEFRLFWHMPQILCGNEGR